MFISPRGRKYKVQRQTGQTDKTTYHILHIQDKHTLLKLSNTKWSTLQLTKLELYNTKKLANSADLEKWFKHAKTTGFMHLFTRHKKFIWFLCTIWIRSCQSQKKCICLTDSQTFIQNTLWNTLFQQTFSFLIFPSDKNMPSQPYVRIGNEKDSSRQTSYFCDILCMMVYSINWSIKFTDTGWDVNLQVRSRLKLDTQIFQVSWPIYNITKK